MTALSHRIISQVESTLCALETLLTETELETQLRQFCRELGFEYFSYIVVNRLELGGRSIPKPMLTSNYPDAWRTRYHKRNYHQLDPVVTVGARSRAPFFWGSAEYLRQLPSLPRRLFDEAGDFGIRSGFTVVVHGPGECGLMSVASSDSFENFRRIALEGQIALQIVSSKVHAIAVERFVARTASTATPLTEQERLCLSWTMRGKDGLGNFSDPQSQPSDRGLSLAKGHAKAQREQQISRCLQSASGRHDMNRIGVLNYEA